MQGLLERVLDHNRHVQEAACSALATLAEEAGLDLTPRLEVLSQHFAPFLQTSLHCPSLDAYTAQCESKRLKYQRSIAELSLPL